MQVTTAMLADAATAVGGKLYVHGGGWDAIYTSQVPAIHAAMAIVLIFKLDWHEANENIPLAIEFQDEDRHHDAILSGKATLRAGIPPVAQKGAPLYHSFAQMFYGLQFPNYGRYTLTVSSGDEKLATLPIVVSDPSALTT
jgi:Family of unknown function (DUF6941)